MKPAEGIRSDKRNGLVIWAMTPEEANRVARVLEGTDDDAWTYEVEHLRAAVDRLAVTPPSTPAVRGSIVETEPGVAQPPQEGAF